MHIYETGSIKKIPRIQEIGVLTDQPSDSSTNALIFCPKIPGALIFSISLEKSDCCICTVSKYEQLWFIVVFITTASTEQTFSTHHILYNLVFAIMLLDFQ